MFLSFTLLFIIISFSKQEKLSKVVETTSGPVRGHRVLIHENKTVYQYLGIPYAKASRFEYPTQENWTEILNANQYGKPCPQASSPYGIQRLEETSEDCLNLNIFVPDSKGKNLTVIVYIGGLLYSFGKANGTSFDPLAVASKGEVILVSLNYRLGILGFFSAGVEVIKGNYGLADQIEALNWLQRNIQRFGGNPDDVTVVGHWSGAMSVGLLLVSPKAQGLFNRVILLSGSPLSLTATLDHVTAVKRARKIIEELKCTNRSNLKACLQSKSVADIILAQEKIQNVPILSPFAPVVDGEILTDSPDVLFKKSNQIKVKSVMVGTVEDDGAIFLSASLPGLANNIGSISQGINQSVLHYVIKSNILTNTPPPAARLISHKYTNWENPEDQMANKQQLINVYTDASFSAPALRHVQLVSRQGIPTYFYHIQKSALNTTLLPKIPMEDVAYGNDVRLLFDSEFTDESMRSGGAGGIVGQAFRMLMEFAKKGNPTPLSSPLPLKWPTYAPNDQYLSIGKSNISVQSKFLSDRIAFWNELLPSMMSQSLTNTPKPTVFTTTSRNDNGDDCIPRKEKTTKALTAVVAVMAIVIVVMLAIIVYQTRMLSKRPNTPPSQPEH